MRINEVTEALPGSPSKRELRRFQADQEKQIAANVDKGKRAWLYKIKELAAAGHLTSQSPTKDYVNSFISFVAGRARINPAHPELIKIKNEFQKDLDSTPGNNRANMRHLEKAIYNIVKGNVQGRFSTSSTPEKTTPAAPEARLAPGVTVINKDPIAIKFDKKIYTLGNQGEWITFRDKKPVTDPTLLAILDKQHEIIDQQG